MIDYKEDWLFKLLFQVRGSVAFRACLFAIPCSALSTFLVLLDDWSPDLRTKWGLLELSKSQLWTATTAVLAMLLAFRTNRAMARFWEGTGLLHQMRGEWFDSISCCVTFSHGALGTKRKEVKRFRHTIVRLMSLCHGSALEEIGGSDKEKVETIDCLGLDNTTLCYLKSCKDELNFNRVEVLLHLTQLIITKALDDGVLKIPPPILSRVYQTLSRGFVNLLNAKKIADTRFPFPYAQLIAILLFVHVFLAPVMISCLIPNKIWAAIFTFVPIFGMFSVNFIGVELENPFGIDENDLPLEHFQSEMNKCLLMLLHEGSDIIATVNDGRCKMKYKDLAASMELSSARVTEIRTSTRPSLTNMSEVTGLYEEGHYVKWDRSNTKDSNMFWSSEKTNQSTESAEKKRNAGSKNDVPGSTELEELPVLQLSRNVSGGSEGGSTQHRSVDETAMHAERDAGGATTMMHMNFDKRCGPHATAMLERARASGNDCSIDHVAETNSEFTPCTPIQHDSIEPTIVLERSTGPVQQSVRCFPSRCPVRTPRHDVGPLEHT